ncbi:MAG TPA: response regulator [Bacteroidota bacterium]|nr:response regulator [Bacteroidota bacterium]
MTTKEKKPRKVLLVDDEAGFADLMKDLLQMDNYEVEVAHDGQEGLEKIPTFGPDVIISDIVMPRLSGFEMFKRVKASPETASIPFLFITGFQDERVLAEARKVGVFGILRKPVDIEQIESRLRELTKNQP